VICHDVPTNHRGIARDVHCARVGAILSAHLAIQDSPAHAMAPEEVLPFQAHNADPQEISLRLAVTAASNNRFDDALAHLPALDAMPSRLHAIALARVLWTWQAGDVSAAERALDTLDGLMGSTPDLYSLVHEELRKIGWWAAAQRYCERTLADASPPVRADILVSTAEAAWILGLHTRFVADIQEAMVCSPDELHFPLRYVAGLTAMGDAHRAREAAAVALKQFGGIAGFEAALAMSLQTPMWTRKEQFKARLRGAALRLTPSWVKGRWWMPLVASASFSRHAPTAAQASSLSAAGIRLATAPTTARDSWRQSEKRHPAAAATEA
ncbi:MAG: hypothetical protein ACKOBM_13235, partial [Gammaproteobacteria bacterium]